jgi:hypothetical protein
MKPVASTFNLGEINQLLVNVKLFVTLLLLKVSLHSGCLIEARSMGLS